MTGVVAHAITCTEGSRGRSAHRLDGRLKARLQLHVVLLLLHVHRRRGNPSAHLELEHRQLPHKLLVLHVRLRGVAGLRRGAERSIPAQEAVKRVRSERQLPGALELATFFRGCESRRAVASQADIPGRGYYEWHSHLGELL